MLYSGWLACGSRLTAPHLPERVMRQFDCTKTIPIHPVVSTPPALTHTQMDDMFDDYESHLAPKEAQSIIAPSDWSHVDGYIKEFFRVSHPYMVQASLGDPPRPAHQEILEEEQTQLDHAKDVLPRYRRIMGIVHVGIDKSIFPDGSNVRHVLDAIMTKAQRALMYWRQHQRMERD
ncbi:unnamed protein product [Lathyrus oleraceus]|uniref:uncharacterized protein LOC127137124 n=1 Tax=Pisum sativum TaxID=3888 RepID=UPI0021D1A252|nr:uncharacterized protein LOC127137124 [Pisum sativum]